MFIPQPTATNRLLSMWRRLSARLWPANPYNRGSALRLARARMTLMVLGSRRQATTLGGGSVR